MPSPPQYRPDIDGLRAIAVLVVIGFHAFPELIPGGFIGVDVFFVISGFLISTILFENLVAQSFSFLDFYSRRIRRIFPALILVLVSCYLVGWFVLLPDEYSQLGKHMAGGAGFIQNWLLWGESGYFDNVAETKPLLHLWSLGIEEQFYIIWPILLWLAYRLRLNLLMLIIFIGLISFALNIHGISVKQDLVATFYSPQTRFWELAIGAVLAYLLLYPSPRWQSSWEAGKRMLCRVVWADPQSPNTDAANLFSYLGLTLIVLGAALINETSAFPGWWALLPTVGALLLLAAGPHAHLNRIILSNRLIVAIGLISYPLYLWHWAILSFLRILAGETPLWWQRALGILIAVALSYLTYRFVEKPIRFGKSPKWQQRKTIALVVLMLIVGGVGYNAYKRDGLSFRKIANQMSEVYPIELLTWKPEYDVDPACRLKYPFSPFCKISTNTNSTIAVIGDSQANRLFWGLDFEYKNSHENIVMLGVSSSPPLLGIKMVESWNPIFITLSASYVPIMQAVANDPNIHTVILAGLWHWYFTGYKFPDHGAVNGLTNKFTYFDQPNITDQKVILQMGLDKTISYLESHGKKVIFVKQIPLLDFNITGCLQRPYSIKKNYLDCTTSANINRQELAEYDHIIDDVLRRWPQVKIWDPTPYFCNEKDCIAMSNGRPLYRDETHLSQFGSRIFIQQLRLNYALP